MAAAEGLLPSLRTIAPLWFGRVAPLAIMNGTIHPTLTAAGAARAAILTRMTFNLGGSVPSAAFNGARETAAMASLQIISPSNRCVRLGLGAVYVFSAYKFSDRLAKAAAIDDESSAALNAARRLGSLVGCGLLCFIGAIWLSSGYHGQ